MYLVLSLAGVGTCHPPDPRFGAHRRAAHRLRGHALPIRLAARHPGAQTRIVRKSDAGEAAELLIRLLDAVDRGSTFYSFGPATPLYRVVVSVTVTRNGRGAPARPPSRLAPDARSPTSSRQRSARPRKAVVWARTRASAIERCRKCRGPSLQRRLAWQQPGGGCPPPSPAAPSGRGSVAIRLRGYGRGDGGRDR